MNKNNLLVIMSLAALSLGACNKDATKFTLDQKLDAIVKQISAETPEQPVNDEMKKRIREQLAQQEALADAARKEGMDKQDEVKILAAIGAEQALASKYLEVQMATFKPSDEELKKIYNEQVSKGQEYHLRHILVDDEDKAKEIITKLKAGERFETLAKLSKDTASAVKGGDLGWMPLDSWVPEFKEAAAKLQAKQITDAPVKTQFGYHVIQLVEAPRAPQNVPAFEAVKPQVLEIAKRDHLKQLQDSFKK
ncbi:MAG: putative parvulin-type peptidyl-prolyl cis-trans isomerase [Burkholderiaceae bacterium]|nr:putative parvulin-type peptidyl-prolyl cis-trans isomerase [Burkholderiaceae bacterium]